MLSFATEPSYLSTSELLFSPRIRLSAERYSSAYSGDVAILRAFPSIPSLQAAATALSSPSQPSASIAE